MKTRIRVVEREQKVFSPIEVAMEDVEKRRRELSAALAQSPPDQKMLQMVLQGSVSPNVHQGPLQVIMLHYFFDRFDFELYCSKLLVAIVLVARSLFIYMSNVEL